MQTENAMTDLQPETETKTETETETDTETETRSTKPPTLNSYEKMVYSPERQQHILYWRDYVNFEGKMKKRYDLYPNQFYRVITKKYNPNLKELETYYEKDESGRYMEYKDIQDDIRQSSR